MPLYEYQCENCGKRFEVIQKFSDSPLTTHEECGAGPVERLLSAPALQFKGSGWYITDYARSGSSGSESSKSDSGKSESKPKSDSDSSSSSKSDTSSSSSSSTPSTGPKPS